MKITHSIRSGFTTCLLTLIMTGCSSLPNKQHRVIDGYSMEYALAGTGKTTVVLESGFGAEMENWEDIFSEVAKFSRVFAYNRRGYGQSLPQDEANHDSGLVSAAKFVGEFALDSVAPGASTAAGVISMAKDAATNDEVEKPPIDLRTAADVVEEQRKLLRAAGLEPPYILVGHSLGGLFTLYYARTYPEEVLGVVLVDSSHPNQMKVCKQMEPESCQLPWLLDKLLPDNIAAEYKGMEATGELVLNAPERIDLPLIVISHGIDMGGPKYIDTMWPRFQAELAAQSSNSSLIIAKNSGHFIHNDEPNLVIESIKNMVRQLEDDAIK